MTETVKEHCKHKDCMYRGYSGSTKMEFCKYLMVTGKSRGCGIADCDKYEKGKTEPISTLGGLWYKIKRKD